MADTTSKGQGLLLAGIAKGQVPKTTLTLCQLQQEIMGWPPERMEKKP